MTLLRQNDNLDDDNKQGEPEAVEGGFGTGLRAQLQKRLHPELAEEPQPEPVQEPEPQYVSYDFDPPATVELNGATPGGRGSPRHSSRQLRSASSSCARRSPSRSRRTSGS